MFFERPDVPRTDEPRRLTDGDKRTTDKHLWLTDFFEALNGTVPYRSNGPRSRFYVDAIGLAGDNQYLRLVVAGDPDQHFYLQPDDFNRDPRDLARNVGLVLNHCGWPDR